MSIIQTEQEWVKAFSETDIDVTATELLGVLVEMEKKTTIRGFHERIGVTHS